MEVIKVVNPWSKSNEKADLDFDFEEEIEEVEQETPLHRVDIPKRGNTKANMARAKKSKNDEFYTQLKDIEEELSHYPKDAFRDKCIYLPTDVNQPHGRVLKSNFIEHFKKKAYDYGYKRLVATCLLENNPDDDNKYVIKKIKTAYYPGRQYNPDGKVPDTPETPYYSYEEYFGKCPSDEELGIEGGYGSGDFRSKHCTEILNEVDIVVTNPPISLFNEVIDWVLGANKQFILFGNRAAMSNKTLFDGIKNNRLWTGYATSHHMFFEVNDEHADELRNDPTRKEGHGNSYKLEGDKVLAEVNACWYTNVEIQKRKEHIILYKKYNKEDYPTYDDYDNIIDVSKTKDIPMDYDGLMGVPVTFLESYCPDQFEIVDKVIPTLNGRKLYLRVVIKRR